MRIKPTVIAPAFAAMLMIGVGVPFPAQADARLYRQTQPVRLYGTYNRDHGRFGLINRKGYRHSAGYRSLHHVRYGYRYRGGRHHSMNPYWIPHYPHWSHVIRSHDDCDDD